MAAIELQQVTKRYGATAAVSDVTFSVSPGEILGFLGPNGAGKTTTIRLLTGFLKPTSGRVLLNGRDMAQPHAAREARRSLGFVPDIAGLDPGVSGAWLLSQLARLQEASAVATAVAVDRDRLADALELSRRDLTRPIGQLSRGTRQKINIVQGLQHRPDLLILDEPTEGLDPLAKNALFRLLEAARARGATIFFSSHILGEVELLCDRVALIRRGELVAVDSIGRLRAQMQRRVTLTLAEPRDIAAALGVLPGVSDVVESDGYYQFTTADLPVTLRFLAGLPVADVTIAAPSLEDIFLRYYKATTS